MNRHPHMGWTQYDSTPRHTIGGQLTGWRYTDATRHVKCPKCGSDAGYVCETPKGRKSTSPHWQRMKEWNMRFEQ
jgi:hypothetical protein